MIIYESDEYRDAIIASDVPVACPITVRRTSDGTTDHTVIAPAAYIAEALADRFADDPFTPRAASYLAKAAGDFLAPYGYRLDPEASSPIYEYTLVSAELLPELIPDDALLIFRPALDEDDPDILADYTCEVSFEPDTSECAAVVVDDRIVCLAQINDFSEGDETEINVECAPDFRRRGYAKAACAELCRFLIENGETVSYKTYASNVASVSLARSLGFTHNATTMTAVGYLD